MANYENTYKTNQFSVTNEDKYRDLIKNISGEDIYTYDLEDPTTGKIKHQICGYGTMCYNNNDDGDDFDLIMSKIQEILPDDETLIYVESGHEKLRDVDGFAFVMTNKESKSISLFQFIDETMKNLMD